MIRQLQIYLSFFLRARHRKGRGIHSPFAFDFVARIIFGKELPGLEAIEDLRKSLLKEKKKIALCDMGAGSRKMGGGQGTPGDLSSGEHEGSAEYRRVCDLARHTAVSRRKGQLLARIARGTAIRRILELGTGTGISSLYLGMGAAGAEVISCEASPEIAELARRNIESLGVDNIRVEEGIFKEWLPGVLNQKQTDLLVFLDGDHRGGRVMEYCGMIAGSGEGKKIIVLDDIYWSPDMYRAWNQLQRQNEFGLSIELCNTGILFHGFPVQEGSFLLRF